MISKRFEPIREIAKTSAKDSGRAMGEAGREVADLERQPEQLKSYRDEYVRNSQSSGAIDAVKLHNYRSFMDRLGEAITELEAPSERKVDTDRGAKRRLGGAEHRGWQDRGSASIS